MPRKPGYLRLPKEVRQLIADLLDKGYKIDEIKEHLETLNISVPRSTLGRWTKDIETIGKELRSARAGAEVLAREFDDGDAGKMNRFNLELASALMTKLMLTEDGEIVTLNPKEAILLTRSLRNITQAQRVDVERELKVRKNAMEEAARMMADAEAQARAAGEKGLTAERIAQLRRDFLGVRPKQAGANG